MFFLFGLVLNLFSLVLLVRVFLSWIPDIDRSNPLVQLVYDVTEPFLRPIREMLPPMAGFDFSPLILMVILSVLRVILRF